MKFGGSSLARMRGLDPRLVLVLERAIQTSKQDFAVFEGVRTPERQKLLYAQGRTSPGKIITWTLNSNHFIDPKTGFGNAVDLITYPLDYHNTKGYLAIAYAMRQAAVELKIPLRWGGDWDGDNIPMEKGETDIGHFELKKA